MGFKYETTFALEKLARKLVILTELHVSNQDKLDALAVSLGVIGAGLAADIQALKDQVAAGQTLDFTAIDAKVSALQSLDAENPPPVTPTP